MKKKEKKENKLTNRASSLWQEFKKFITKGNVIDLSIGVIMGSAFGAIVTAFTNILLSVCTWGVPGGISGLVTILPAVSQTQISPLGEQYQVITAQQYLDGISGYTTSQLSGMYTQIGTNYYYKGLALINWGEIINAIISFIIIALVLFIILKVYTALKNRRLAYEKAKLEKYYQEHPEERPVEKAKEPTELDLLKSINESLKILASKEDNSINNDQK